MFKQENVSESNEENCCGNAVAEPDQNTKRRYA
jgi:hypothetical protein